MIHIHGVSVTLINLTDTQQVDDMNRPIMQEAKPITVDNVLIGEPSTDDVISTTNNHSGHTVKYTLGIPKGDTNDWVDALVKLPVPFGGDSVVYRTIGVPTAGIEANIPLLWNKKVLLEVYR